tara:strand:+ start:708 stop:1181 length:474 start_codon:yes stop_codon:yes gene_type:complete
MKLFNILVAALVLLFASASLAATNQATNVRTARGYTYLMCDEETNAGTAVCENTTGEIYAIVDRFDTLTFTYLDTGSGNSCDIYGTDQSSDVAGSSDLDAENFEYGPLNSVSLSDTQESITLYDISFHYIWVTCNGGGSSPVMSVRMSVATSGRERQ